MATQLTLDTIKKFEGFASKAYWDVNAWRAGYGSDTITYADGRVVSIKKGMIVLKADAERDLSRRADQFESRARSQVTKMMWDTFSDSVKAGLISMTYNYGSLPTRVVVAAKTGVIADIADAVESCQTHNNGVNRRRRILEAKLIRS